MQTASAAEIAQRAHIALAGKRLRLAVLFGSHATGRARATSDVDIAIVPGQSSVSLWDEGALAADLERALGCPVDLVRLDLAPTLLRWEIIRAGRPILADPPEAWTDVVVQVIREHADFAPLGDRVAAMFLAAASATGSR